MPRATVETTTADKIGRKRSSEKKLRRLTPRPNSSAPYGSASVRQHGHGETARYRSSEAAMTDRADRVITPATRTTTPIATPATASIAMVRTTTPTSAEPIFFARQ